MDKQRKPNMETGDVLRCPGMTITYDYSHILVEILTFILMGESIVAYSSEPLEPLLFLFH